MSKFIAQCCELRSTLFKGFMFYIGFPEKQLVPKTSEAKFFGCYVLGFEEAELCSFVGFLKKLAVLPCYGVLFYLPKTKQLFFLKKNLPQQRSSSLLEFSWLKTT